MLYLLFFRRHKEKVAESEHKASDIDGIYVTKGFVIDPNATMSTVRSGSCRGNDEYIKDEPVALQIELA